MKYWLLLLSIFYIHASTAEPLVIHDSGIGISTAPYKKLFSQDNIMDFRHSWIFGDLPEADIASQPVPPNVYPITTTLMTPKRLTQSIEAYFPRMVFPICIVGDDELSHDWVKRNRRILAESGAQCFLVSASSAESADPILRLLDGILVYPGNGDAIAQYFKIKHYPVLINDRYASQ
ncbi:MAG: integrating conjugative element protein [Candidatus Thiodiazotropha sp.]|jgi:integrating conjugative element protein (TIGR03765 family)